MSWLWRKLFGRDPHDPRVFHYFDDMAFTSRRSADPIEIELRLEAMLGADWKDQADALRKPLPFGTAGVEREEAAAKREQDRQALLAAIDAAFDVKAYSHPSGGAPSGLTEAVRLGLLDGFREYCIALVVLSRPLSSAPSLASGGGANPPPPSSPASSSPVGTSATNATVNSPLPSSVPSSA